MISMASSALMPSWVLDSIYNTKVSDTKVKLKYCGIKGMNKKQKFQAFLAVLIVIYIIVLLFFPGWKVSKILSIFAGVSTLIALYGAYKAEEKNKT